MSTPTPTSSSAWLAFALLTALSWGVYGVFLHSGQVAMGDPTNGRYKAFLWVGIAYFLIAVLAPLAMLLVNHSSWTMPLKGITWSTVAGAVGAIGAFCVLLSFGAGGRPAFVMSIIFAGAPVVNAVVALAMHPPAGGLASLRWQFLVGIILAAAGGMLVSLYKPAPGPSRTAHAAAQPGPRGPDGQ